VVPDNLGSAGDEAKSAERTAANGSRGFRCNVLSALTAIAPPDRTVSTKVQWIGPATSLY